MAYVAISGEFIERVKNKINTMHRAERQTLGEEPRAVVSETGLIVQKVWGAYLPLRSQLPDEWVMKHKYLDCKMNINERHVNFRVDLASECTFPPNYHNHCYEEVDPNDPELSAVKEYMIKRLEIDDRWEKVQSKVVSYLHSCKSLNEAVKLWPDVEMYIDKHDIERMGVKHTRAKESAAMEALRALDTDELVGAAVIARMSGAQV